MNKTFILDTNVLLLDPLAINKFGPDNKVFIPLTVIEELDRFKKDQNENGRNARYFSRLIDGFRSQGSLFKGVKLDNGGSLQVSVTKEYKGTANSGLRLDLNDNIILASALTLKEAGENVILITKDINLRLKSDALNIHAEDYETTGVTEDELYSGQRIVQFDLETIWI